MVSAENLNYDVLELIFTFLFLNDLAAVSQVSQSFRAGCIPRLYKTIIFRHDLAKRYPRVMSPFAVILAHPYLAVHVRRIDIRSIPVLHSQHSSQAHPAFLRDCIDVIAKSSNLISFTCTPFNSLPPFLSSLQEKGRLQSLRISASSLASEASAKLLHLSGIKSLTLENASWIVVDSLPKWMESLQSSITHLTLYMISDLNSNILTSMLPYLPRLRGLHIIGCPGVDHVAIVHALRHFPLLESLAFSMSDTNRSLPEHIPDLSLTHLRHIAIDSEIYGRLSAPTTPGMWSSLFTTLQLWASPLMSVALKPSTKGSCQAFLEEMMDFHAPTLKYLSILNCSLNIDNIADIAEKCIALERLAMPVADVRDLTGFRLALRKSSSIHTLIDVGVSHTSHGPRVSLTNGPVRRMMEEIPCLRKVVSETRHWTGTPSPDGIQVTLERKKHSASSHWFLPP